mgnify:CR=1 FL=1
MLLGPGRPEDGAAHEQQEVGPEAQRGDEGPGLGPGRIDRAGPGDHRLGGSGEAEAGGGQHQGPDRESPGQAEEEPPAGRPPVREDAHHPGQELRHRHEGDEPQGGEADLLPEQDREAVAEQDDRDHHDPPRPAHRPEQLSLRSPPGQQEVVDRHRSQGHRGDDHHPARRGEPPHVRHHRQHGARPGDVKDECVRVLAREEPMSGPQHRRHGEAEQEEHQGEAPARAEQRPVVRSLREGDVELAGQQEARAERQQQEGGEAGLPNRREQRVDLLGPLGHPALERAPAPEAEVHGGDGQDHRRDQLDHRLEGDGHHQASVPVVPGEVSRPEQEREHRDQQAEVEGHLPDVLGPRQDPGRLGQRPDLKSQVGHARRQQEERDQDGAGLTAITEREQIGHAGQAVLADDPQKGEPQNRDHQASQTDTHVDGEVGVPLPVGHPDAPEEGPAGGVDPEREAVDPRPARPPNGDHPPLGQLGDQEQEEQVQERGDEQRGGLNEVHRAPTAPRRSRRPG